MILIIRNLLLIHFDIHLAYFMKFYYFIIIDFINYLITIMSNFIIVSSNYKTVGVIMIMYVIYLININIDI